VSTATASDPLLYSHPLPVVATPYPSGFALELSTDSAELVALASGIWGEYPKLFDASPVRLRIAVSAESAAVEPRPSMPRGQENLVSFIHGQDNFAIADMARGFGFGCLTSDVVRYPGYAVHHFLEPLVYLLLAAKHVTILHAACVALNNRAVLLAGDSGSGKTCLAYACARSGWTFLSGDTVQFARGLDDGMVIGRPFTIRFRENARELFPELKGYASRLGFNGKIDIEARAEDLNITTSVRAHAGPVVFLNRSPHVACASLCPVAPEEAFRRMASAVIFGDEQLRSEQLAALARFMEVHPAFDLNYSHLADADGVLRSLLQGLHTCFER
jgi:hypothetical protein